MPGGDTDREKQEGMEGVGLIIHMMKQLSGMKRTARALERVLCVSCNDVLPYVVGVSLKVYFFYFLLVSSSLFYVIL